MRIAILTFGSRGDVQPFIALARGLLRAGYQVRLAAPARFAELVRNYGLDFHPLPGEPEELARLFVDEAGVNPFKTMKVMSDFALPLAMGVVQAAGEACEDADLIIHNFIMLFVGDLIARERGIPQIHTNLFPVYFPTKEFPVPALPMPDVPLLNRFGHWFFTRATDWGSRFGSNVMLRRKFPDFPKMKTWPLGRRVSPPIPALYGISPSVLPTPKDWPAQAHMAGYWFLDEDDDWKPPLDLVEFLAAGPPPVYLGFGSMVTKDRQHLYQMVIEGIRESGQRAVLYAGWAGLRGEALGDEFFVTDGVPHSWLFPQMAAIVHHGGAGTTAASLRSGVPTIVVPFAADQPFWGYRIYKLGAGPRPIPRRKLTAEKLAGAIREAVGDQAIRQQAEALGARIRAEDGVGDTVRFVDELLNTTKSG